MLSKWPIRNKLYFGVGLLLVIVATLSASGFLGVYSYRAWCAICAAVPRSCRRPIVVAQVSELRLVVGRVRHGPQCRRRDRVAEVGTGRARRSDLPSG